MTDNQFYVFITVLGAGLAGIGTAIKFSAGRIIKALDKNTDVMFRNTESNTILSTKIDTIFNWIERRGTTPIPLSKKKATNPGIAIVSDTEEE